MGLTTHIVVSKVHFWVIWDSYEGGGQRPFGTFPKIHPFLNILDVSGIPKVYLFFTASLKHRKIRHLLVAVRSFLSDVNPLSFLMVNTSSLEDSYVFFTAVMLNIFLIRPVLVNTISVGGTFKNIWGRYGAMSNAMRGVGCSQTKCFVPKLCPTSFSSLLGHWHLMQLGYFLSPSCWGWQLGQTIIILTLMRWVGDVSTVDGNLLKIAESHLCLQIAQLRFRKSAWGSSC